MLRLPQGKQLNYEKILRNAFEIKDQLHAAIEMGQAHPQLPQLAQVDGLAGLFTEG